MKMKYVITCFVFVLFFLNVSFAATVVNYGDTTAYLNITLINQIPDPADAGDIVELRFMVENLGGKEVNNVIFELLPQFPFSEVPGETYNRTITKLKGYQQGEDAVIIKYKVFVDSRASRGTNEIRLKERYADPSVTSTRTFDIEVTGSKFAQIIYIDKAKIYPGNETKLKFTITNVGNSPLRNLVFSWSEENGIVLPVYSDDTKYINNIGVGQSAELEYIVVADVNADSGLYKLDLSLRFDTETGTTEEMTTKAGIFVGGETDFDVTFSESSEGQTSLSVANTGNNPALSVTVRIPEQDNFIVSGSSSSIIGNLDRGDYTIVSFQISQSGRTMGSQNFTQMSAEERQRIREQMPQATTPQQDNDLKVLIDYTDTTGVRHVVEKFVPISFRDITTDTTTTITQRFGQRTDSVSGLIPYILLIVIVVAAVICYKKRVYIRSFLSRRHKIKKG